MPDEHTISEILQAPNVTGYVHCADNDEVLARHGEGAELLATMINPLVQAAALLGRSLGLDELRELQLHGRPLTALCLPCAGGTIGVMLDSRAHLNDVARTLQRSVHGA